MRDMICPRCNSGNIVKNGNTVYGRPKFMCRDCRKHFVENPGIRKITDEKKEFTEKMLSEKISPAGICRVLGISQRRLQSYVDEIYQHIKKNRKQLLREKFVSCKNGNYPLRDTPQLVAGYLIFNKKQIASYFLR